MKVHLLKYLVCAAVGTLATITMVADGADISGDANDRTQHLQKCIDAYAAKMSTIFDSEAVRSYILDKMSATAEGVHKYYRVKKIPTTSNIVLNVGPGSSGTRSLFLAAVQLNVTGRHFDLTSRNCTIRKQHFNLVPSNYIPHHLDFDSTDKRHFDVLNLNDSNVFWGDAPVPENWWNIFVQYPKTKMIMTEMDPAKWWNVRVRHICNDTRRQGYDAKFKEEDGPHDESFLRDFAWKGCTTPVPFNFDTSKAQRSVAIFQTLKLTSISLEQNKLATEAYKDILKCAVPASQLFFLDITKQSQKTSAAFWAMLIDALNLKVQKQDREMLVESGVPYIGSKGCKVGTYKCDYDDMIQAIPERKLPFSLCKHSSEDIYESENRREFDKRAISSGKAATVPTAMRTPRLFKCAAKYVNEWRRIFNDNNMSIRLQKAVSNYLLRRIDKQPYATSTVPILNVGPGSSNLRSLFVAMAQLNITGRYSDKVTANCTLRRMQSNSHSQLDVSSISSSSSRYASNSTSDSSWLPSDNLFNKDLSILNKNLSMVYWGDDDVSELWWQLLVLYPSSKIIMLETDPDQWHSSRMQHHCAANSKSSLLVSVADKHGKGRPQQQTLRGCTALKPFQLSRREEAWISELIHLSNISITTSANLFNMYKELVKCAVPASQLLVLDLRSNNKNKNNNNNKMSKGNKGGGGAFLTPAQFWSKLTDFLDIRLTTSQMKQLVTSGIPSVTSKSCTVDNAQCDYHAISYEQPQRLVAGSICNHDRVDADSVAQLNPSQLAQWNAPVTSQNKDSNSKTINEPTHMNGVLIGASTRSGSGTTTTTTTSSSSSSTSSTSKSADTLRVASSSSSSSSFQPFVDNMYSCAATYAKSLGEIYGSSKVADYANQKLSRERKVPPPPHNTESQIVLNVGPGSSGTRSLFLAIAQLNVTARHFDRTTANCTIRKNYHNVHVSTIIPSIGTYETLFPEDENDQNMKVLKLNHSIVLWGDIPVPEIWFDLLLQYPTTKLIMTDMDADKWYKTRREQHCTNTDRSRDGVNRVAWKGCTPPVPFRFNPVNDNTVEVYNLMRVSLSEAEPSRHAFDAYRELLRCVAPTKQQLHWVDMTKQSKDTSERFWNDLTSFLNVKDKIGAAKLKELIAGGVPYVGSRGCRVGGEECDIYQMKNEYPERMLSTSVCNHEPRDAEARKKRYEPLIVK